MRVACETQRTHEWFTARLGKITASESGAVLSRFATNKEGKPRKEGETAERFNYKVQLAAERLTSKVTPQFVSIWMKNGSDYEDFARAEYEVSHDVMVEQTGFVLHPRYDFFGASPDGLLPGNGVLELKVPAPANHLKYLLGRLDPIEEYGAQMLGEVICCEASYCVFASFNPDFPQHRRLFTKRYERGEILEIAAYEREIAQFEQEVDAIVAELRSVEGCLVPNSLPSPEELASQDMRDLEQTWTR